MQTADWAGLITAIMAFIAAIGSFIASWKAGQTLKDVHQELRSMKR